MVTYKRKGMYNRYPSRKRYNSYKSMTPYRRYGSGYKAKNVSYMTSRYARTKIASTDVFGAEIKYCDFTVDGAVPKWDVAEVQTNGDPPANSLRHYLCHVAQGSAANQRNGAKLIIKKIMADLGYHMASKDSDTLRFSVILDKQTNGSTVGDYPSGIFTGVAITDFQSIENSRRFQILYQKNKVINYNADHDNAGTIESGVVRGRLAISLACDIPIEYSGANADQGAVRSNGVFLLIQSLEGKSTIAGKARILFSDL